MFNRKNDKAQSASPPDRSQVADCATRAQSEDTEDGATPRLAPPPPVVHPPPALPETAKGLPPVRREPVAEPRFARHRTPELSPKRGWKNRFYMKMTSTPAMFLLATIALPGILLGARFKIVETVPGLAPLYTALGLPVNLDGLDLRNVISLLREDNGKRHLLVQGEIVNLQRQTRTLPNLHLELHGGEGAPMYAWQAPSPHKRIEARAVVRFVARLDAPPEQASTVKIRFAGDAR